MKKVLLAFVAIGIILAIAISVVKVVPVFKELNKTQQIRIEIQREEVEKIKFYTKVEQICIKYALGDNKYFNEKFDTFLAENDIKEDTIVDFCRRLQTYNNIKWQEFFQEEEQLKDSLERKDFKEKRKKLLKDYLNSFNTIESYLSSNQKNAFEKNKERIEELFLLVEEELDFYQKVEQICLKYAFGDNEDFNEKFDEFLAKNSINEEDILDYAKKLKTSNNIKREEFFQEEEQLKNSLSQKDFENKRENLLKDYLNSLKTIENYLSSNQKKVFENNKEFIEKMFLLI